MCYFVLVKVNITGTHDWNYWTKQTLCLFTGSWWSLIYIHPAFMSSWEMSLSSLRYDISEFSFALRYLTFQKRAGVHLVELWMHLRLQCEYVDYNELFIFRHNTCKVSALHIWIENTDGGMLIPSKCSNKYKCLYRINKINQHKFTPVQQHMLYLYSWKRPTATMREANYFIL